MREREVERERIEGGGRVMACHRVRQRHVCMYIYYIHIVKEKEIYTWRLLVSPLFTTQLSACVFGSWRTCVLS